MIKEHFKKLADAHSLIYSYLTTIKYEIQYQVVNHELFKKWGMESCNVSWTDAGLYSCFYFKCSKESSFYNKNIKRKFGVKVDLEGMCLYVRVTNKTLEYGHDICRIKLNKVLPKTNDRLYVKAYKGEENFPINVLMVALDKYCQGELKQ